MNEEQPINYDHPDATRLYFWVAKSSEDKQILALHHDKDVCSKIACTHYHGFSLHQVCVHKTNFTELLMFEV